MNDILEQIKKKIVEHHDYYGILYEKCLRFNSKHPGTFLGDADYYRGVQSGMREVLDIIDEIMGEQQ